MEDEVLMMTVAGTPRDPPMEPLESLRQATGPLHEALDHSLPLARPGAGLADYALHLQALHGWLNAVAPCLERIADTWPLAPGRMDRLLQDLRDCPVDMRLRPGGRTAVTDHILQSSGVDTRAYCWGVAYVVEGSSLGGQVLFRRLAGPLHPHPLRYLQGDGADTGARWRRFTLALRAQLATRQDIGEACRGAVAAFDAFGRHIAGAAAQPA